MPRIKIDPTAELDKRIPEPNFLMIYSDPEHIWVDEDHYVESDSRQAEPGKHYYLSEPEWFLRVLEIHESEEEPVEKYGVKNAEDTVVVENVYTLNMGNPRKNLTDELSRFQIETERALSMGDIPFVPFDKV